MKNIYPFFSAAILYTLSLAGAEVAGVPRDSNFNNTGGYDGTRVEAQLLVNVKDDTQAVHFIRDNNDPRVVTRCYLIKHVDPYEFRDYLRTMVQAKRVGNTSPVQQMPGNSGTPPSVAATVSQPELSAPANVQTGYNPPLQLGSNTAVECLKYVDGTGLLIVSAEEYRFRDHENGMGIDRLVAMLDNPEMGDLSSGDQMFIYMPKFVPARNLMPLIENMGMNISDVTELWQGQDVVAYDPDLNWLIFDVSNYSCENIAGMLEKYDVPIPQVRLTFTVYEIYSENDDKLGIDFQNWKNNEGTKLFSAGGRYRNNWAAAYSTGDPMKRGWGSERTSFYNLNPRWNTRYIDFLAASGRAKVASSGELVIRNGNSAHLERTTRIFYSSSTAPADASALPDTGVGPYELLSAITGTVIPASQDIPVGKGQQQNTAVSAGYGFSMDVSDVSVNLDETRFTVKLNNTSLIGFQSDGTPRIAPGNTVEQEVSLPHGKDSFVIGGLRKQETVKSKTGIPWLKDIPYLGYLFSTQSASVKNAELILVANCQWEAADDMPGVARSKKVTKGTPFTP